MHATEILTEPFE